MVIAKEENKNLYFEIFHLYNGTHQLQCQLLQCFTKQAAIEITIISAFHAGFST